MKKSLLKHWMLALPMLLGLSSCIGNEDNPGSGEEIIDPGDAVFTPEKLTMSDVWIADGVDADLAKAFVWASVQKASEPSSGEILVVNKLTDVSEDVLKSHIQNFGVNGLICVTQPVKSELDLYKANHDWIDFNTTNISDSTMIFGFGGADQVYDVMIPTSSENADPVATNVNKAQDYYVMITGMLDDYASKMEEGTTEKDAKSIESFGSQYHYQKTYTFICHEEFKHVVKSDRDYHDGTGSLSASFDIYTAHVYEGEPGAGDYYAVNMTSSIASSGMWKGTGDNQHGGFHVRWVGAYATNFYSEAHLKEKYADWDQDLSERIIFPSGGYPSPSTTVGQTSYTNSHSFSLNMSQSIGGSNVKKGSNTESSKSGELSFSEGWNWQKSESRSISDVDVVNETFKGNWARWRLQFNNLPKLKSSLKYDIGNNLASRGTMDLHSSWLWYDKSGKDNQDRNPYDLCIWLRGDYQHQNFTTTQADLKTKNWSWSQTYVISLPKIVNVTAGCVVLKNDLADGMTLSNVKIIRADNNKVVSEFLNTVPNGEEQNMGYYNSNYKYMVTFMAKKNGGQAKTYKYTLNPSVVITHKATTKLYAASDFTAQ